MITLETVRRFSASDIWSYNVLNTTLDQLLDNQATMVAALNALGAGGAPGGLHVVSWYTPGTYSFTVPASITSLWITASAGGGGSSSAWSNSSVVYNGGAGGGGASCFKQSVTVTPGSTISIVIGAGGSAGAALNPGDNSALGNGSSGGVTMFGSYVVLVGGSGGGAYSGTFVPGVNLVSSSSACGGPGGSGATGGSGQDGSGISKGGFTILGLPGDGSLISAQLGGGGSGRSAGYMSGSSTSSIPGQAGGNGFMIIEY